MAQLEKEADEDEEVYEKVACWLLGPCAALQVGCWGAVPQAGAEN